MRLKVVFDPACVLSGASVSYDNMTITNLDVCIALSYNAVQEDFMDQQLTLRLPSELAGRLDKAAKRLARNRSEVVRIALEDYLAVEPQARPIELVRDLLGRVESGVPDLGQHHREYLLRRLKDGR